MRELLKQLEIHPSLRGKLVFEPSIRIETDEDYVFSANALNFRVNRRIPIKKIRAVARALGFKTLRVPFGRKKTSFHLDVCTDKGNLGIAFMNAHKAFKYPTLQVYLLNPEGVL